MKLELSTRFTFDAADRSFRGVGQEGDLYRTYLVDIAIRGLPDPDTEMIIDLRDVHLEIEAIRITLNDRDLDEVLGLGANTLESLCAFIWQGLKKRLPQLSRIRVENLLRGDACAISND